MKTAFILLAQYETALIPHEKVAQDYFGLSPITFLRKCEQGAIPLPIVRMESSQKAAKGVLVSDLAEYIDRMRDSAKRDLERMLSC